MDKRGSGIIWILLAVGLIAILIYGKDLLPLGTAEQESYVETRLNAVDTAEDLKKDLEYRYR